MEDDNTKTLDSLLIEIIKRQVDLPAAEWLQQTGATIRKETAGTFLSTSFAALPRKTGKSAIEISSEELALIHQLSGITVRNWPLDKLGRLWLLLQVSPTDEKEYVAQLSRLFRDAEMNELSALYAALPVFAFPESWQFQTTEGIRSNIGSVLEAIMYDNPYPYNYLPEPAWNQLIMKAFFTDKDINRIFGLDRRSNKELSLMLIDYAHERQAAHRMVHPQLWRLVSKFIDEHSIADIEKLFDDGHIEVRRAAVLACYGSDFVPARRLLDKEPGMLKAVESGELSWAVL